MIVCDAGEIAIVPFPFTDIAVSKPRPALALSGHNANDIAGNTVFAMITTAARSRWPSDVPLADLAHAGLTAGSVVRFKLFTLDNRLVARTIGSLSRRDRRTVKKALSGILGI